MSGFPPCSHFQLQLVCESLVLSNWTVAQLRPTSGHWHGYRRWSLPPEIVWLVTHFLLTARYTWCHQWKLQIHIFSLSKDGLLLFAPSLDLIGSLQFSISQLSLTNQQLEITLSAQWNQKFALASICQTKKTTILFQVKQWRYSNSSYVISDVMLTTKAVGVSSSSSSAAPPLQRQQDWSPPWSSLLCSS